MSADRPTLALVTDAIHPWHRGGKEARYRELARRLSETADVHVYTMNWWRGEPTLRRDGVTYHAIAPYLPLYSGERRSMHQALVFALCCLRLLFRRFDAIEADHMPYLQLFPLRLVATLRRKRLVVTWHECWGLEYWNRYMGRPGRLGWWLEKLSMRLPDTIVAASPETAERLRAQVGDRVPVVTAPNGVDLEAIRAAAPSAEGTDIVTVGRLISHKRIDRLLAAVAILRARGTPVTCRIIGDGPERGALTRCALELEIADSVEFRHDVSDEGELYSLLKAARVFAFPSEREGFGIAALEGFACGLPVVTTSAPDNLSRHLVAGRPGGIVCAPDHAAFADALERALGAHPARQNGWLAEYSWDGVTERVAEVLAA